MAAAQDFIEPIKRRIAWEARALAWPSVFSWQYSILHFPQAQQQGHSRPPSQSGLFLGIACIRQTWFEALAPKAREWSGRITFELARHGMARRPTQNGRLAASGFAQNYERLPVLGRPRQQFFKGGQ